MALFLAFFAFSRNAVAFLNWTRILRASLTAPSTMLSAEARSVTSVFDTALATRKMYAVVSAVAMSLLLIAAEVAVVSSRNAAQVASHICMIFV